MALSTIQRAVAATIHRSAADEWLTQPLWNFHPSYRLLILSERQRRGLLQGDPEPIGDPEYT